MRPGLKIAIFAALVVGAAAAAFVVGGARVLGWVDGVRALGVAGAVAFGVVYALATVLMVPGTLLTLAGGFLYGPVWSLAVVWPGALVGSSAAFVIARYLARDWVRGAVEKRPRFQAVDRAVERGGFLVVMLLRLSPLFPFNLSNYALGVTGVRYLGFLLGTAVGILPATALYAYIGSTAASVAALSAPMRPRGPLLWVGLVATIAVTVVVTRLARRQLEERL